jgi:protein transport protein SEC24
MTSSHCQVVCETIKAALDSLPGDERTLVGLVTYDAHVHFYNLSAQAPNP